MMNFFPLHTVYVYINIHTYILEIQEAKNVAATTPFESSQRSLLHFIPIAFLPSFPVCSILHII